MRNTEEKKILIVADDENILRDLVAILKREGYYAETAKTRKEAINKYWMRNYVLALLDINMPNIKATEFLAKIHKKRPNMIIILITAYSSLEYAIESLTKGADWYFIKPLEPKKLFKVVEMLLKEQDEAEKTSQLITMA